MSQITIGISNGRAFSITLRLLTGLLLIWKAFGFVYDTAILDVLAGEAGQSVFTMNEAVIILVAALSTVISGIFIIVGRFVKVAALVQLPIVALATLFIHGGYIERSGIELLATIILPFLLLVLIAKKST